MVKILIFLMPFLQLQCYEYVIAICSVFKDEAPWLKEWIEYHKILGVSHFRLYNNESSDNYLEVLAPYINSGEVMLLDWPNEDGDLTDWACLRQWPACINGLVNLKNIAKWVALIDIDEFILPIEDYDLIAFLEKYEEYPALVLNWQCFGTSHIVHIPNDKLMIEALTRKAKEFSKLNKPVKSIVRPEFVNLEKRAWAPHTVSYLGNQMAVFPDKVFRKETLDQSQWEIHPDKCIINHYVHRTEDFFWNQKLAKKKDMKNWSCLKNSTFVKKWHSDCNKIEDTRILRFASQLKKTMGFPEK